jgi:hypothetical protein
MDVNAVIHLIDPLFSATVLRMTAYKDRQNRTYRAEWQTFTSSKVNLPFGLPAAKRLITEYLPKWELRSSKHSGTAFCYTKEKRIVLSKTSPLWIVCHEIAHGLVEEKCLPPGHHEVFRRYYIDVCEDAMSPYWANKLSKSFDAGKLDYRYPHEQPMTLAQRFYRIFK